MANKAVFGIYATRREVESAVDELKAQGFRNTDISVLFPENVGTKEKVLSLLGQQWHEDQKLRSIPLTPRSHQAAESR